MATNPVFLFIILLVFFLILIIYISRFFIQPKKLDDVEKEINSGQTTTAIRKLRNLLRKQPENYKAHYLLGKANKKNKNNQMAIMELHQAEKGIDNETTDFEINVRRLLSDIHMENNDYKSALEEYLLLTKIDTDNKKVFYNIGRIYKSKNHYRKAVSYFKQATQIDSNFSPAYYELGVCLYETANYSEALTQLSKCIKLNKKNYYAYFYLGLIHKQLQDNNKAIEFLEQAERESSIRSKVVLNLGICHIAIGNLPKAIEELTRALKIHTSRDNILLNIRHFLAMAYEQSNDLVPAIEQWEKITAQSPGYKGVDEKLNQYNDLRHSDSLKEFINSSLADFQKLCSRIVEQQNLTLHEINRINNEKITIVGREASNMIAAKAQLKLFIFSRENITITEKDIRNYLQLMKNNNCSLAYIYSINTFNASAKKFAENRPIELYDSK
ncbi:MAG TPA: tetratricopeptide repeat protein, partial [Spirochaetota bacterium]|nr:tetratricopeptide repeat protein [Spirochaetota bacterium]